MKNLFIGIALPVLLVCAHVASNNIGQLSDARSIFSLFALFFLIFSGIYLILFPFFKKTKIAQEIVFMYGITISFSYASIVSTVPYAPVVIIAAMLAITYLSTKEIFCKFSKYLVMAACASQMVYLASRLEYTEVPLETRSYGKIKQKPNVYFFVIDALPIRHVLKLFPGAGTFLSTFEKNKFSVSDKFYSNYPLTAFCLSSQFLMEYHKNNVPSIGLSNILCGTNNTVATFKDNGYKYFFFSCQTQPEYSFATKEGDVIVLDSRPAARIFGRAFFLLSEALLKSTPFRRLVPYLKKNGLLRVNYLEPSDVQEFLKSNSQEKPFFLFAHFMHFHDLAITDNGKRLYSDNCASAISKFGRLIDASHSLEAFEKKFIPLLDHIIKNDPTGIVIVQGDHGSYFLGSCFLKNVSLWFDLKKSKNSLNLRYKPFFAVRFGEDKKASDEMISKTLSCVNIFRHLFNKLGASDIKPLADHAFICNFYADGIRLYFTNIDEIVFNKTLDSQYKEYIESVISDIAEKPLK